MTLVIDDKQIKKAVFITMATIYLIVTIIYAPNKNYVLSIFIWLGISAVSFSYIFFGHKMMSGYSTCNIFFWSNKRIKKIKGLEIIGWSWYIIFGIWFFTLPIMQ